MSDGGTGQPAATPGRPLTVAELIARLEGDVPSSQPRRHRARPEREPEPYPELDDLADHDTAVLPVIAGPAQSSPT